MSGKAHMYNIIHKVRSVVVSQPEIYVSRRMYTLKKITLNKRSYNITGKVIEENHGHMTEIYIC